MNHPLYSTLQSAVPLRIIHIKKQMAKDPDYSPLADLINFVATPIFLGNKTMTIDELIASKGDALLFGGNKDESAKIFNLLAQALALMSFIPNGVRFGDLKWISE